MGKKKEKQPAPTATVATEAEGEEATAMEVQEVGAVGDDDVHKEEEKEKEKQEQQEGLGSAERGLEGMMEAATMMEQGYREGDEEEPTPVKRLDAAFQTVQRCTTQDAPALQVFLRVRPIPPDRQSCMDVLSESKVRTTTPSISNNYKILGQQMKEYTFNRVFGPESTQEEMFKLTTEPLVDALYMGRSGLLFAYGVTNAGKTFTIMGTEDQPGVLPRALNDIFSRIKRDEKTTLLASRQCSVVVSYLEVYNDQIFDLLNQDASGSTTSSASHNPSKRQALKPADRGGRIEVKGLSKHEITNVQQGLNLVRQGGQNRRIAATRLNLDSSRSHSVFTVELVAKKIGGGGAANDDESRHANDSIGTLWIVDLAGSERGVRTGNWQNSKLRKEASGINTSLMKLWRCLDQLRKNQAAGMMEGGGGGAAAGSSSTGGGQHQLLVPFRESKITHLFMNHLSGASVGRTVMVLNANPSKEDYDETSHVLNQGSGAQEIRVIKDFKRETRHRHLLGGTHDYDGRRLVKRRKSMEKAAAKQKGGGSSSLKLPFASITNTNTIHEEEDEEDEEEELSGVESDTALTKTGRKSIAMRRMVDVLEENRALKETIETLKDRLMRAETEIREEVADEMAHRMSQLEQQIRAYRESSILSITTTAEQPSFSCSSEGTGHGGLREGGREEGEGPGSSAQKIHLSRLERYVKQLEEEKNQVEEEMLRLRQHHEEEVNEMRGRIQGLLERGEHRDSIEQVPGLTVESLGEELKEAKKQMAYWQARALKAEGGKGGAAIAAVGGVEDLPPPAPTNKSRSRKRSKGSEEHRQQQTKQQQQQQASIPPPLQQPAATLPGIPPPLPSAAAGGAVVLPPPAPTTTTGNMTSLSSVNDRKMKIQERIRQQILPKKGNKPEKGGGGAEPSGGEGGGKTPVARRLRSRHGDDDAMVE